jgi:hypothetical protein
VQAALVIVVLVFGVLAALVVGGGRKHDTANNPNAVATPSIDVSPTPSPSAAASPSPSASPSAAPSPSPAATEAPTAAPQPTQSSQPVASGPAAYPAQVKAGSSYGYTGPRAYVAHATDSVDSGSSACAGINESTQAFPSGYEGVFYVGVVFPDGNILSAGYIRTAAGRKDFASFQNASGSTRSGVQGADPGAGSHTYCVTHTASGWSMTDDGKEIYASSAEGATGVGGATVKFDSDVQAIGSPAAASFTFVIPGFHDITVGGQPPHQLRGSNFYS